MSKRDSDVYGNKNDDDDPLKTFQILLKSREPPVSIRDLLVKKNNAFKLHSLSIIHKSIVYI